MQANRTNRARTLKVDHPTDPTAGVRTELRSAPALVAIEAEISWGSRPEEWHQEADAAMSRVLVQYPNARRRDAYLGSPRWPVRLRALAALRLHRR